MTNHFIKLCFGSFSMVFLFFAQLSGAMADVKPGSESIPWKIDKYVTSPTNAEDLTNKSFTNLTFPMIVKPDTLRASGIYFAYEFSFMNTYDIGYMGLQPRPDKDGKECLHAAFSSFIKDSTTDDPQCHLGADGGPGVSCAVDFEGHCGDTYDLTVHKTAEHTWSGDLVDRETGEKVHIGTWSLPKEIGDLHSSYVGFLEYYGNPAGPTWHSCSEMAKAHVVFGPPYSTDYKGTYGRMGLPHFNNDDDCKGAESAHHGSVVPMKLHFANGAEVTGQGYEISRGFITNKTK